MSFDSTWMLWGFFTSSFICALLKFREVEKELAYLRRQVEILQANPPVVSTW